MKIKGKDHSFIRQNRKKITATAALVLCLGIYAVTGSLMTEETGSDDIPLHDGDVLVTSDDISDMENTDTYLVGEGVDMDRNEIISMLEDAEASAPTAEEKKNASREKMKLLEYMEQEKTVEALIKNKNLPDTFVVITDNGVNVTVNTEKLDQPTVTKICEIIMRQTDRKASEIVVQDAS